MNTYRRGTLEQVFDKIKSPNGGKEVFQMKVNVNEVAKVRAGTYCKFCGRPIMNGEQFFPADGGALGSIIYGHTACADMKSYSYKNTDTAHIATYSGFCWGAEFETNTHTTKEQRLQLKAWYDLDCTSDCTVSEEFKSPIIQGIHGAKKYLQGVSNIIDIANGDNCGTHLNFSLAEWSQRNDLYRIKRVLRWLSLTVRNMTDTQRVNIFGRTFGDWAQYTESGFKHGDYIAVHGNRLELRIARFKSVEQYSHLIMLCKVWSLELNKFLNDEQNETQTADKMKKALQKHLQGTATYQRPERNK